MRYSVLNPQENLRIRPLEILRLLRSKSNLIGLSFETLDNSEIFANMLEVLSKYNVRLVSCSFSSVSGKRVINGVLACEISRSRVNASELIREIKSIKGVLGISYETTKSDIIFDLSHFPLLVSGTRAVIFLKRFYKTLLVDMRKELSSAGKFFVFKVGELLGSEIYRMAQENGCKSKEEFLGFLQRFFKSIGLGILIYLNVENGFVKSVRVNDSFECELVRSNKPYGQFVRGILMGALSRIYRRKVEVKEIKCKAKGDSYCEFEIIWE